MTLYALDDIGEAIDATRALLWPFDSSRWAKLAIVVFFIGSVGGGNPLQFGGSPSIGDAPDIPGAPGTPDALPSISGPELAVITTVMTLIALIGLLFMLVGSIMEFVFVESLRREAVTIRRFWSTHWRRGLRLFGFRLLLGILTFGIIGLLIVVVFSPVLFGNGGISLGLVGLAIPLGLIITIISGLVYGFTTMFVVPAITIEDRGVISAWRQFWPTMTGQWKQYAAYAVVGFILRIAGGIVTSIATALGALVVTIPLGIVGLLGIGVPTLSQIAGWAVIAIAAVLFVVALILLVVFASVPVQTFLRYYALLVLGDTNETFDVIPRRRRTVRG